MKRWMAKSPRLAMLVFGFPLCIVLSLLLVLAFDTPIWGIVLLDIFILVISYTNALFYRQVFMKEAIDLFDNTCDPEPLLKETELQLSYGIKNPALTINRALAHRAMGEYEKNLELLKTVDGSRLSGMPIVQSVYYNNLADAYDALGRYDAAEIWFEQCLKATERIKNVKLKEQAEKIVTLSSVKSYIRKQEYDKALETMRCVRAENLRMTVTLAMNYGEAYAALGEYQKARENLQYVILNGGKCYVVEEAKKLMSTLPSAEK